MARAARAACGGAASGVVADLPLLRLIPILALALLHSDLPLVVGHAELFVVMVVSFPEAPVVHLNGIPVVVQIALAIAVVIAILPRPVAAPEDHLTTGVTVARTNGPTPQSRPKNKPTIKSVIGAVLYVA